MFIDGQLVRLKLEKAVPSSGNVGEHLALTLSAPATTVRADLVTSWTCPKDSESCEVTEYLGTVTVISGTKSGSLEVWGACGC